jgi:hypothetical protein
MPISSPAEFETVLKTVLVRLDRVIHDNARDPALEGARRQLAIVHQTVKAKQPIGPAQARSLAAASATLRARVDDEALGDQLWDLSDFAERSA